MIFKDLILNLIFPPYCLYCEKPGASLCSVCQQYLESESFPVCIICENLCINGNTHKYCKQNNQYAPDSFRFNYVYNFLSRKVILSAKSDPFAYTNIKTLLDRNISQSFKNEKFDLIVPIPPSASSNRLQDIVVYFSGFLSTELNIPIRKVLENTTKTQKKLDRSNRVENTLNKFKIKSENTHQIEGKSILLIDDISTTGLSIINAAKILKQLGANKVVCYALCKDLRYNRLRNV